MRRTSVDLTRGILILLVIAGHSLLGDPASIGHYFIYSFHMPLFAALSGYVLNWTSLPGLSPLQLAKKYWHRPILPWLTAVIVYRIVDDPALFMQPGRLPSAVGMGILRPYFHLWFIPSYLSWVLLSWLLLKLSLSIRRIFILSVILSVIGLLVKEHTIRMEYYLFFVLGGLLKNTPQRPPLTITAPLSFILLAGNTLLFYYHAPQLSFLSFFILNGSLTLLMVTLIEREKGSVNTFLEWTGRNSLGIYLWHVLPLLLIFHYHPPPLTSYGLTLLFETVLFMVIFFSQRINKHLIIH